MYYALFFVAKIHSKGVKMKPENPAIFPILYYNSRTERTNKGTSRSRKFEKILKLCEYVGNFLLISTQFLFAAQIHSKGL